jgi:hypothetical protein
VQEFVKGLVSTRHHAGRLHFQRRNKGLTYSYIGMYCGRYGESRNHVRCFQRCR